MTFTEALEQYLTAREEKANAPEGCDRWERACDDMKSAARHLDALTAFPAKGGALRAPVRRACF